MSAHTPGPWHWEADAVKGDPTGRVRYQVTALGKTVTRVYYSSFEGGPTNAEYDARLIAAAPMLLDELRMCEAHLHAFVEAIESGGGSASQSVERLAAVRDAIAKATGAAQ